jgi:hypothetical protein
MRSSIQPLKHQRNPSTGPSSCCEKRHLLTPIGATRCPMVRWMVMAHNPVPALRNVMSCEVVRTDSR